MANPGGFRWDRDQLQMHINNGVPLSQDKYKVNKLDTEDSEHKSKNIVLPKVLPDVFSMSFYNPAKKKMM